jgi:hypothetical protein
LPSRYPYLVARTRRSNKILFAALHMSLIDAVDGSSARQGLKGLVRQGSGDGVEPYLHLYLHPGQPWPPVGLPESPAIHHPRPRPAHQRPRYGLNFWPEFEKGRSAAVAHATSHSRCSSPSPRSCLQPTNLASFCKNSLRRIPVTRWRWLSAWRSTRRSTTCIMACSGCSSENAKWLSE